VLKKKIEAPDPIREATIDALKHIVDSLLELMFETGITVQQFNYVVRDRAVRAASSRVLKETGRSSKSRVSIITGLPRSEVTRISSEAHDCINARLGQSVAQRILAAWFESPSLLSPNGEPATLSIFGNKRSFEKLVSIHGGGIPVRAMLDELTRLEAVERVGENHLKVKSRTPVSVGLNPEAIGALGQRCSDLIRTSMRNVRRSDHPLFEATSLVPDADFDSMPVVRREISLRGANFIGRTNSFLKRVRQNPRIARSNPSPKCRVGVTVFYFEDSEGNNAAEGGGSKRATRKNLHRVRSQDGAPPTSGSRRKAKNRNRATRLT
jgi:Family of unknown function (DUF6502)